LSVTDRDERSGNAQRQQVLQRAQPQSQATSQRPYLSQLGFGPPAGTPSYAVAGVVGVVGSVLCSTIEREVAELPSVA
jgi:hypothetical protein